MTDRPLFSPMIDELAKALANLQADIPNPPKTFSKGAPYPYAKLDDCLDIAKKHLPKHGFAYTQPTLRENGESILVTLLLHTSGQWLASYDLIEPVNVTTREGKLKNNSMQAYGSGKTYARRIGLLSVLGLVGEEDDDAESLSTYPESIAQNETPIINTALKEYTKALDDLKRLCKINNIFVPDFCNHHHIRSGDPGSIKYAIENFPNLKKKFEEEFPVNG